LPGGKTVMRRHSLVSLFLLTCCALPVVAQPGRTCTVSATAVAFGSYTGVIVDVTGTVTVTCPNGRAYDVALSAGTATGATVTNRSMTGPGSALLGYGLYSNATHTTNWGNTAATNWVTGTGTGAAQPITVYAQLPAAQYVAPGSYADTITVTVSGTRINTVTTTFAVTATLLKDCAVSATNMIFGNYTGAVNNVTSTVSVTCTSTTTYTVGLSAGLATGATVTTRKMQNGTALLPYALYSNSGRTTNWGNTAATGWVAGTGTGIAQPLTVYGQIAAGHFVTPGSYTDTITATVTY
jgi:spore coat protein U-like protein